LGLFFLGFGFFIFFGGGLFFFFFVVCGFFFCFFFLVFWGGGCFFCWVVGGGLFWVCVVVSGGCAAGRETVFAAYKGLQRMVRRGTWKLIEYTVPGQPLRRQLFDLAVDPWEMRNLALEPRQEKRVAEMSAELERQREALGAPAPER
jgi:hypothetical protein